MKYKTKTYIKSKAIDPSKIYNLILSLLVIGILFYSNKSFPESCDPAKSDSLLFSSGGVNEEKDMELLKGIYKTCSANVHYGKEGLTDDDSSHSSNTDTFYKNLAEFTKSKATPPDPLTKTLHITGHGTYYRPVGVIARRNARPNYDFPNKLPVNLESNKYLQINVETCLSGNTLSQMMGIPPNKPFDENEYLMMSKDGKKKPSALKMRDDILKSSKGGINGRTTCGLASATGHTSSYANLDRPKAQEYDVSLPDTIDFFKKKNNGRRPTIVEMQHCTLRNKRHKSAPISSSNILLEHLSHKFEKEKKLSVDNTNIVDIIGSEQCFGIDILDRDTSKFFEGVNKAAHFLLHEGGCGEIRNKENQQRCWSEWASWKEAEKEKEEKRKKADRKLIKGINQKKLELQNNINYILDNDKNEEFKGIRNDNDKLRAKLKEVTDELEIIIDKLEKETGEVDKQVEKERKAHKKSIRKKIWNKGKTYREKSRKKQRRIHKKLLKDTKKIQELVFGKTPDSYQSKVNKIIEKDCRLPNNLLKDESPKIKIGNSLSRGGHKWKYSDLHYLQGQDNGEESCIEKLKKEERDLEKKTKNLEYQFQLLNPESGLTIDQEVKKKTERMEKQREKIKEKGGNIFSMGGLRLKDDFYKPGDFDVGGAKVNIDRRYFEKLVIGILPEEKVKEFEELEEKMLKASEEKYDRIQIKRRQEVSRNNRELMNKLRKNQLLNTQLRSLLALDHLQKNLGNKDNRLLAEKLMKINECERSGPKGPIKIDLDKIVCGTPTTEEVLKQRPKKRRRRRKK